MTAIIALIGSCIALAISVYAAILSTRTVDRVAATITKAPLQQATDTIQELHKQLSQIETFFGTGRKRA